MQDIDHCLIGIISDTHGLSRLEAARALKGSDMIIHAGDVGSQDVLDNLRRVAPVVAVRGNTDTDHLIGELPETEVVEIGGKLLYVLHELNRLALEPATAGFSVIIHGHSHHPSIEEKDKVLFLNPGSAGPRRFGLPVSVAILSIKNGSLDAEIIGLKA